MILFKKTKGRETVSSHPDKVNNTTQLMKMSNIEQST